MNTLRASENSGVGRVGFGVCGIWSVVIEFMRHSFCFLLHECCCSSMHSEGMGLFLFYIVFFLVGIRNVAMQCNATTLALYIPDSCKT